MITLIILAITLFIGAVLYGINNLVSAFNTRCQQKFYTQLINCKSFIFTIFSLSLISLGIYFIHFANAAYQNTANGIALIIIGILALILIGWHNFQKTNFIASLIGNLILFFFSALALLPLGSLLLFLIAAKMLLSGTLPYNN